MVPNSMIYVDSYFFHSVWERGLLLVASYIRISENNLLFHLSRTCSHTSAPSYLSTTICDDFVQLMGEQVLSEIRNRIQIAKYFSISVDSTQTYRTQTSSHLSCAMFPQRDPYRNALWNSCRSTVTQGSLLPTLFSLFWTSWALTSVTVAVNAMTMPVICQDCVKVCSHE